MDDSAVRFSGEILEHISDLHQRIYATLLAHLTEIPVPSSALIPYLVTIFQATPFAFWRLLAAPGDMSPKEISSAT